MVRKAKGYYIEQFDPDCGFVSYKKVEGNACPKNLHKAVSLYNEACMKFKKRVFQLVYRKVTEVLVIGGNNE